ncbi:Fe-S cluster assembly protein SufB [Candidatus Woesearchaeota archaeon]|nr:Fe-S cluster assembly protein SufB [Candidatus Woesearchaeota archaeon]
MTDDIAIDRTKYDQASEERLTYKASPGITEELVRRISQRKDEPAWMLDLRLKSLKRYQEKPLPTWGPSLKGLELDKIHYYLQPDAKKNSTRWEDVPEDIKQTFEQLGIPEAERRALAGTGAQYESEMIYHKLKEELKKQGVIFLDMDVALKEQEALVKEHFNKCVPYNDHKFAMLHYATWSGGTFIHVPKGVKAEQPLQAYFRMNAERGGQFEHTLIIIEEGAEASYIEGCSAPRYDTSSLHAGCVELFVKKGAQLRYSSVENWSGNTYNLNTKRAIVDEDGIIEWVSGNLGSGTTMLYPTSILKGNRSKAEHLSISFAAEGQHQDTGAKAYHLGKNTSSTITAKSISKTGGTVTYRGVVKVNKGSTNARSNVECDSLMIGNNSVSNTIPLIDVKDKTAKVGHEARVGRIGEEQLFYLQSRGLDEEAAIKMIVSGFIEPITKELPLEYAMELNKLIELEMEGTIG